jgi:hypothetical protein
MPQCVAPRIDAAARPTKTSEGKCRAAFSRAGENGPAWPSCRGRRQLGVESRTRGKGVLPTADAVRPRQAWYTPPEVGGSRTSFS